MGTFEIKGGKKLKGNLTPQGAKNEALQILCAVLLTPEKVTIENIPDIIDVNKLIDLLRDLGVKVEEVPNSTTDAGCKTYTFKADNINIEYLNTQEFKKKGSGL